MPATDLFVKLSHVCVALQVGELEYAGNGRPVVPKSTMSVQELDKECAAGNFKLLERLREDEHAALLLQACVDDAKKGRMTQPRELSFGDMASECFSARFGVEQGGYHKCEVIAGLGDAGLYWPQATRCGQLTIFLPPESMLRPPRKRNWLMTLWTCILQ